jgi:Methyltransferase FkbM domain
VRNPVARPAVLGIVAAAGRLRTAQRRRERRRVPCEMTTISAALRDHDVDAVDLVKIDVEGAEWEVLRGIEDPDWSQLRQFVIEVHDIDGRLARMTDLLRSKGYVVATEHGDWALLRLMDVSMLYARRSEGPRERGGPGADVLP